MSNNAPTPEQLEWFKSRSEPVSNSQDGGLTSEHIEWAKKRGIDIPHQPESPSVLSSMGEYAKSALKDIANKSAQATDLVSYGIQKGNESLWNAAGGVAGAVGRASDELAGAQEGETPLSQAMGYLKDKASEYAKDAAPKQTPRALNSTAGQIVSGIAEAPAAVAKYALASAAGGPIGMGALDAAQAYGEGEDAPEVIKRGTAGYLMGQQLHAAEGMAPALKATTMAGIGASQAAAQGGDTKAIASSAATMALLAMPGAGPEKPPEVPSNEALARADQQNAEQVPTVYRMPERVAEGTAPQAYTSPLEPATREDMGLPARRRIVTPTPEAIPLPPQTGETRVLVPQDLYRMPDLQATKPEPAILPSPEVAKQPEAPSAALIKPPAPPIQDTTTPKLDIQPTPTLPEQPPEPKMGGRSILPEIESDQTPPRPTMVESQVRPEVTGTQETVAKPIENVQEPSAPIKEPDKGFVTSIKNDQIDKERVEMGLPPATHGEKVAFEQAREFAAKRMAEDPFAGQKIVEELQNKPRPIGPHEDALLLHEQTRLRNERNIAEDQFIKATQSGDEVARVEIRNRIAKLQDDYKNIGDVVTKVGTLNAQGLAFRRMMMKEDYSLASMERRKIVANDGKPLTPSQIEEVKTMHDKIAFYEKVHAEQLARIDTLEREAAINAAYKKLIEEQRAKSQIEKGKVYGSRNRLITKDRADAARAKLRAMESTFTSGVDPSLVLPMAELGLYHFEAGAREFGAWSSKMMGEVGEKLKDKVKPFLEDIWKEIREKYYQTQATQAIEKIKRGITDGRPLAEMGRSAQEMAKNVIASGVTDREKVIDAVHGELKKIDPNILRRDAQDAISGYGQFRQLSKGEIEAQLRDLKGQIQQVSKLQDMAEGKAPLKTGVERRTPTDEERRLIQQVNEAKKAGGFNVVDPETQLKSALDAVKTRLSNQIADLESQIASGERIVKGKNTLVYDAEANALKARRDELKTQFDTIFGKRELTDQQRIDIAKKAIEKSIADYDQRIKTGDLFPDKKLSKTPSTPELNLLRSRRDTLKEQLKTLQYETDPVKAQAASLQAYKTRVQSRIADLQDRLDRKDFSVPSRRQLILDKHATDIKANLERTKQDFDAALMKDKMANRTLLEKVEDTFLKWRRGFILSSPVVFSKLTGAAALRLGSTPIEEAIGGVIGHIPKIDKIANKAMIEGGFNVRAEARALTQGFTEGMKDAWHVLTTGKSKLDVLYKKQTEGMPPALIDFIGHLHGAIKAPVKRAAFERALMKGNEWAIKNGLDPTDPLVQTRVATEAYKAANRSIFMQDNRVSDAWKQGIAALERPAKGEQHAPMSSRALATAMKAALPIVKVPTNIVAEAFTYAFGTVTGSARAARAYAKGIENLKPEEADLIMRQLKKGSIGFAVLVLGFFNPQMFGGYYQRGQKRKEGDVEYGGVRIGGVDIPRVLVHNPLAEMAQLGASIRRIGDSKLHKKDQETQGYTVGAAKALMGLTEEVPFIRETVDIGRAYDQPETWVGRQAESLVVPQVAQWWARRRDVDAQGKTVKRNPKTIRQYIEEGIPGLRETLPIKKRR